MTTPTTPTTSLVAGGRRRWNILLYGGAALLFWMGLYIYVPTLPTYVRTKTDTLAQVGLVLSMYGLVQLIVRIPLGIASDWLGGRKPFILLGMAMVGLGAWLLATAESVTGLAIGRATTGLGAATWVVLIVAFSSLFPPEEAVRATAIITLFGAGGRTLVTASTGWLNELGGYALAFYLAVGSAVIGVLALLPAGEKRRQRRQPSARGIVQLVVRPDVLLPALMNAVFQYGNYSSTMSFFPVLAKELGASDVALGLLTGLHMGLSTLGTLAVTTIVKRVGERPIVYFALGAMTVGVAGASLVTSVPLVFLVQCLMGVGWGMANPTLMGLSIRHVDEEQRSTAMGLHQAVYSIGMFAGPWLSGILADGLGMRPMFAITGILCGLVGLVGTRRLENGN